MRLAILDEEYQKEFGAIESPRERVRSAAESNGLDVDILNLGNSKYEDVRDFGSFVSAVIHLLREDYDYLYIAGSYYPENLLPIVSKFARCKLIYDTHCLGVHKLQSGRMNWLKRLITFPFLRDAHIRCLSSWEAEKYRDSNLIFPMSINRIPYGVDAEKFQEVEVSSSSREVFSIANARPLKDLETQVRAIDYLSEEYSEVRLNVIGGWKTEEYRKKIASLVEELDIEKNVIFHGFKDHSEMINIISRCSVFVHTSEFESQGLSIYEAAATGASMCLSDVPVFNRNFERFKHPQGDHEALAEDIKTIFEMDEEEKQEISEEMRELAKDFSYEKEMERLEEFFERIDKDV